MGPGDMESPEYKLRTEIGIPDVPVDEIQNSLTQGRTQWPKVTGIFGLLPAQGCGEHRYQRFLDSDGFFVRWLTFKVPQAPEICGEQHRHRLTGFENHAMEVSVAGCFCEGLARNEDREHSAGSYFTLQRLCEIEDANVPGPRPDAHSGEISGHVAPDKRDKILIESAPGDDASIATVKLSVECDCPQFEPRHLP